MVLMTAILETKVDALKLYLSMFFNFVIVLLWFCNKLNITDNLTTMIYNTK